MALPVVSLRYKCQWLLVPLHSYFPVPHVFFLLMLIVARFLLDLGRDQKDVLSSFSVRGVRVVRSVRPVRLVLLGSSLVSLEVSE